MKKYWALLIIIPVIIGIIAGICVTISRSLGNSLDDPILQDMLDSTSSKYVLVTGFNTYGETFNITGKIDGILKDNFEGAKVIVTDGKDVNDLYDVKSSIEDDTLYFENEYINNFINLDKYDEGKYYVLLRLRLNNSSDYKYYLMKNDSEYGAINYYTLTDSEHGNKNISIDFDEVEYKGDTCYYLAFTVESAELADDVYDIVIDPACGGEDLGETYNGYNEASLMLEYAIALKEKLEDKGYKVKLTRDEETSKDFTLDEYAEDGRISIACTSHAKYMISLHLNGTSEASGFEIYTPNDCDLSLARTISLNLKNVDGIEPSDYDAFKVEDGVYTKNYNTTMILDTIESAKYRSYDAYDLTTSTPYLYTIREVGGIATHAYVDGRNPNYSKNEYFNSNQGIECYQIYLGYINNDLDVILEMEDEFVEAIADAF